MTARDTVAIVVQPAPATAPPPVRVPLDVVDSTAAARSPLTAPWRPGVTPNPIRVRGTLNFLTQQEGPVRIEIYDIQGRLVAVPLDDPNLSAGEHSVEIPLRDRSGTPLGAGVYFYRVNEAARRVITGRILIAP
jgi:hypothetical protein